MPIHDEGKKRKTLKKTFSLFNNFGRIIMKTDRKKIFLGEIQCCVCFPYFEIYTNTFSTFLMNCF